MIRRILVLGVAMGLAACGATGPTLTYQQQVAIGCGGITGELAILQGDGVFTGGAADTLTKTVQPAIDKVCAAGATATADSLTDLVNTGLPAVKALVNASPSISQQEKNAASAAIDTAVLAFNTAKALQPVVQSTAAAPAAASAPQ